MNILRLSTLALITVILVPINATAHCKGKHTGDHPHCVSEPPPPPPVESCAGASGVFPSFAYTTYVYDGKKGSRSGTNLHLANSDGSCSIIIYTQNDRERLVPNYRQIGNDGRIVWSQSGLGNLGRRHPDGGKAVVRMLDFSLENGALVGTATVSTVYMYPGSNPSAGGEPELSADGSVVFFGQAERLENGEEPATLYSIDLSNCTSLCSAELILPPGAGGQSDIAINPSSQRERIYRASNGGGFGITFIEATETGYSDIRTVVLPEELGTSRITKISVGNWDYYMDGTAEEVIAIVLNFSPNTITIIDVSDCDAADGSPQQTCLASGESTILRMEIEGARASFLGEDLLLGNGDNVEYLDTDSLDTTFLLQGDSPDSAE